MGQSAAGAAGSAGCAPLLGDADCAGASSSSCRVIVAGAAGQEEHRDDHRAQAVKQRLAEFKQKLDQHGPSHVAVGLALLRLGRAHRLAGGPQDAKASSGFLLRAVGLLEKAAHQAGLPEPEALLAEALVELAAAPGEGGEQEAWLRRALAIHARRGGEHGPEASATRARVGLVCEKVTERLSHLQAALDGLQRSHGRNHPQVAATLMNLSFAHGMAVRRAKASGLPTQMSRQQQRQFLERAILPREVNYSLSHPELPGQHRELRVEQMKLSLEELEKRRDQARASLEEEESEVGPTHPEVVETAFQLGCLHLRLGEAAAAVPLLERALRARGGRGASAPKEAAAVLAHLAAAYGELWDTGRQLEVLGRLLAVVERELGRSHVLADRTRQAFALLSRCQLGAEDQHAPGGAGRGVADEAGDPGRSPLGSKLAEQTAKAQEVRQKMDMQRAGASSAMAGSPRSPAGGAKVLSSPRRPILPDWDGQGWEYSSRKDSPQGQPRVVSDRYKKLFLEREEEELLIVPPPLELPEDRQRHRRPGRTAPPNTARELERFSGGEEDAALEEDSEYSPPSTARSAGEEPRGASSRSATPSPAGASSRSATPSGASTASFGTRVSESVMSFGDPSDNIGARRRSDSTDSGESVLVSARSERPQTPRSPRDAAAGGADAPVQPPLPPPWSTASSSRPARAHAFSAGPAAAAALPKAEVWPSAPRERDPAFAKAGRPLRPPQAVPPLVLGRRLMELQAAKESAAHPRADNAGRRLPDHQEGRPTNPAWRGANAELRTQLQRRLQASEGSPASTASLAEGHEAYMNSDGSPIRSLVAKGPERTAGSEDSTGTGGSYGSLGEASKVALRRSRPAHRGMQITRHGQYTIVPMTLEEESSSQQWVPMALCSLDNGQCRRVLQ